MLKNLFIFPVILTGMAVLPPRAFAQTPSAVPPGSPYAGSVASAKASSEVVRIGFEDAIERGLKQNLGALLASHAVESARGERWNELSHLLPTLTTNTTERVAQENLAQNGIKIPKVNPIVGPFGYFDTRAYLSTPLFDWHAWNNERAASENLRASEHSYKDARELVVLVVGYNYLQTIASAARVETTEAQRQTAEALYNQAADRQKAGTSPAIDALRANVEFQTRKQQVISTRNDYQKQRLTFARTIGLAPGQAFELTEKLPYDQPPHILLDEALQRAYASRSDYQSALARVRGAELSRRAAVAEYFPTLEFDADYGAGGITPAHIHGTFEAIGSIKFPIFQGGKVHADVLKSDAALADSRAQLENLRGQIDQDIRNALFDLQSASEQVEVARGNVDLANQTLEQARDRFTAGVTDNVEVVQAQEAVASANEAYISSLYSYNVARISVARAEGIAEVGVMQYLKGR